MVGDKMGEKEERNEHDRPHPHRRCFLTVRHMKKSCLTLGVHCPSDGSDRETLFFFRRRGQIQCSIVLLNGCGKCPGPGVAGWEAKLQYLD